MMDTEDIAIWLQDIKGYTPAPSFCPDDKLKSLR